MLICKLFIISYTSFFYHSKSKNCSQLTLKHYRRSSINRGNKGKKDTLLAVMKGMGEGECESVGYILKEYKQAHKINNVVAWNENVQLKVKTNQIIF